MKAADLVPRYNVELIVSGKKHEYRVVTPNCDGSRETVDVFPGVTGILGVINKPALVAWSRREAISRVREGLMQKKMKTAHVKIGVADLELLLDDALKRPDKLKDDAAATGTSAHEYIDAIIKGKPITKLPNEILTPVRGFSEWWAASGIEFVLGDTKVASRAYGYGGSLDALGLRRGVLVLIDFKTSRSLWDSFALQVAAYAKAFEEQYNVAVPEALCVRFRKDGVRGPSFECVEVRDIDRSFAAFLAAKALHESLSTDHFVWP